MSDVFLCEDAHAQERSLLPEMPETVKANDVWIADRNFCTRTTLLGIDQRQAYFIIRGSPESPLESARTVESDGHFGHRRGFRAGCNDCL